MARGSTIRCVELTPELWPDLEALFGPRGACAGCWCMWWRVERGGALWDRTRGAPAKRAFKKLVQSGKAHGILAFTSARRGAGSRARSAQAGVAPAPSEYSSERPVGWCAFGPREDFPRVATVRAYKETDTPPGLWSINCFYIDKDHRGRGVARALLAAALAACKRRGARVVEGYPVDSSKKLGAAFAWTGPSSIFDERGFRAVPTPATAKPLVRLKLRG